MDFNLSSLIGVNLNQLGQAQLLVYYLDKLGLIDSMTRLLVFFKAINEDLFTLDNIIYSLEQDLTGWGIEVNFINFNRKWRMCFEEGHNFRGPLCTKCGCHWHHAGIPPVMMGI